MMEFATLGSTDLRVSRVCLGCMGFGDPACGQHKWTLDEAGSRQIIHRALDLGINFFDTAVVYQGGTSEEYLGRAIRDFVPRREAVIATKFPVRSKEEIENGISGRTHVKTLLEKSLKNLNTDYIDLYILHMWDYNTPIFEILEGLNDAVSAGQVRFIGISNCFAWQLCKANALAEKEGFPTFRTIQGHYNLIFREEEREMIPYCKSEGIAVTPYSPLAGGRLSKHPGESSRRLVADAYAKFKYDATEEQDAKVIARVAEIAEDRHVSMTQVALSWLIHKGAIPVCGATKETHLADAVKATELSLTDAEIQALEEMYVPHRLVGVMAENH